MGAESDNLLIVLTLGASHRSKRCTHEILYEDDHLLSHVCVAIDLYAHLMYRYTRASIQTVTVGPSTSYRSVASRRVHGKPRPLPLLH